jgi:hypothetical protein
VEHGCVGSGGAVVAAKHTEREFALVYHRSNPEFRCSHLVEPFPGSLSLGNVLCSIGVVGRRGHDGGWERGSYTRLAICALEISRIGVDTCNAETASGRGYQAHTLSITTIGVNLDAESLLGHFYMNGPSLWPYKILERNNKELINSQEQKICAKIAGLPAACFPFESGVTFFKSSLLFYILIERLT